MTRWSPPGNTCCGIRKRSKKTACSAEQAVLSCKFLVSDAPVDHVLGGLAAAHAGIGHLLLNQRHATGGHARLFLHLQLAVQLAAPHGLDEAALLLLDLLGLFQRGGHEGVVLQVLLGPGKQTVVDGVQSGLGNGLQLVQADEDLLDEICRKESYNEIVTAMLSLEDRYRDVLTLYYLNDLSLSEIAELQGVKENTVKQQLYRGRRKLIDTIKKEVNTNEKRQSNRKWKLCFSVYKLGYGMWLPSKFQQRRHSNNKL